MLLPQSSVPFAPNYLPREQNSSCARLQLSSINGGGQARPDRLSSETGSSLWQERLRGAERPLRPRYSARWTETTCRIGRPVVLSLGYTRTRLTGVVTGFRTRVATQAAATIYGEGTRCAIRIRLEDDNDAR